MPASIQPIGSLLVACKCYKTAILSTSSLQSLIDEYLADCRARGLSPKTLKDAYGYPLQQVLLPWCERRGITEPRELDNRTLNQLTSDLLDVGGKRGKLSRFTVDTYVRNVNLFLGWCRREGEIGDVRVVLFVKLREGLALEDGLVAKIKNQIRTHATPRHVPAKVVQVPDIPRTKSNKIVELAVRDVVHGRPVKNLEALANPEALAHFRNRPELAEA